MGKNKSSFITQERKTPAVPWVVAERARRETQILRLYGSSHQLLHRRLGQEILP